MCPLYVYNYTRQSSVLVLFTMMNVELCLEAPSNQEGFMGRLITKGMVGIFILMNNEHKGVHVDLEIKWVCLLLLLHDKSSVLSVIHNDENVELLSTGSWQPRGFF